MRNPTTDYSVATSLACADDVATEIADGADPAAALWPTSARWVHELRIRGLSALLDLSAEQTLDFFDAFFTMPIDVQRSYLSERDNLPGTLKAMGREVKGGGMRTGMTIARGAATGHSWSDV